jgi:two-component system nitrate/nitrite response regulator NarL
VKPIRVLLVDDHALFRSGIEALLSRQTNFEVAPSRSAEQVSIVRTQCLC